jgi:hypothetical protein
LAILACLFYLSPVFAGLLLALLPASSVSAQSTKTYKIGALTKSLANPYFLLMKQGYEYAQKKLGVEVVFGSTKHGDRRGGGEWRLPRTQGGTGSSRPVCSIANCERLNVIAGEWRAAVALVDPHLARGANLK